MPDTTCRWITVAGPQPMRSPPACQHLLRAVPHLAPRHALTREVWSAMLSDPRQWMMNPGARYLRGPVLEQPTAPTPGVCHALHRASALTEQLTDEVLDVALELLRVLYLQTQKPPGLPGVAAPRRGRPPGRPGGTGANTPQPVHRAGP